MTEDPKKTRSDYEGLQLQAGRRKRKTKVRFRTLLTNSHTLVPLLSGVIQVLSGLAVVCVTILGLISPLWISADNEFRGLYSLHCRRVFDLSHNCQPGFFRRFAKPGNSQSHQFAKLGPWHNSEADKERA
jgi:hypothetical protein